MASRSFLAGLCRIKHHWRPVVTRQQRSPKSLKLLRNRSGKGHNSCARRMRGGGAVQRGCRTSCDTSRKSISNSRKQARRHTTSIRRVNGPASPRRPRAETLTLTRQRRELPRTAAHRLRQLCHAAQPGSKPWQEHPPRRRCMHSGPAASHRWMRRSRHRTTCQTVKTPARRAQTGAGRVARQWCPARGCHQARHPHRPPRDATEAAALAAALARPRAKAAEAASISDGARPAAARACA